MFHNTMEFCNLQQCVGFFVQADSNQSDQQNIQGSSDEETQAAF